jgi:hypothetical protein
MPNITQIPAPRVPVIDEKTGLMSREWYRFFINLFNLTGDGTNTISLTDLQVGPPSLDGFATAAPYLEPSVDLAQLQSDVDGLKLAPRVAEIHPIPYGSFFDTSDQTGSITVPTPVTFNSTDVASGVYLGTTTSRMYVTEAGVYSIQFSVQVENTVATEGDVNIWLRINGTNVIGSNGLVWVPAKHAGADGHIISGWNFFLTLSSNDYVELVWLPSAVTMTLQSYPAVVGPPAVPSTYSAVLTAFKVNLTLG